MNKKLLFQSCYQLSLYTKFPKKYQPSKDRSWFQRIFSQAQSSPTYYLLQQLYDYIHNTEMFHRQFPFLHNNERIIENNMLIHVCLLRNRLASQQQVPRSQIQKFNYNLQSTFFPQFAAYQNPHIPTKDFKQHYSEVYIKKLQIFDEDIKQYEFSRSSNRNIAFPEYAPLFRKLIYENRLSYENNQLIKYCKYYYAHKKYLNKLSWEDIIQWKVKWGFQQGKFLGQVQKP